MNNTYLDRYFPDQFTELAVENGWPKFRGKQISEWIYKKYVTSFDEMTNLPLALRTELAQKYKLTPLKEINCQISRQENTIKWLSELEDGTQIETVLMRHSYGNSLCISTQAGCAMGCTFCASTLTGLERNLTASEMWGQVRLAERYLRKDSAKLDSLVVMGIGEPFQNLEELIHFFHLLHDPQGADFSYRRITVSTSGIVPGIQALEREYIPVSLAISLHAPTDTLRSQLMPINRQYPIRILLAAAESYAQKSGRRVTYEYLLLDQINDQISHAKALVELLKGKLAIVNLIPYNEVAERPYKRSTNEAVQKFYKILSEEGITVSIRREMGRDIAAACGQLRLGHS